MIQRINKKREEQGFTLIELLIVIIILAILAAIVVFAIGTTRKDSVTSSCKTDLKSIELSAQAVNTRTGTAIATTVSTARNHAPARSPPVVQSQGRNTSTCPPRRGRLAGTARAAGSE